MAGIGIGMGIGLGGRLKQQPPNPQDVTRWFTSVENNNLIDNIASRNAPRELLNSSFNGVDGLVSIPNINTSPGVFEFSAKLADINSESVGTILNTFGEKNGMVIELLTSSKISVVKDGVEGVLSSISVITDGDILCLRYNSSTGLLEILINNILDNSVIYLDGFDFSNMLLGNRRVSNLNPLNADISDVELVVDTHITSIPFPHLKDSNNKGYGIDANGNRVETVVNGGVTASYGDGSDWLFKYGFVRKADDSVVPNNMFGLPLEPLEIGDTLIPAGWNTSPHKVRLFTAGDLDDEYKFFDKDNDLIWKQAVRDSVNYFSDDTGLWDVSELTQEYIYENIQDAYKYQFWIKIRGGLFKDIILYPSPLTGDDICTTKRYIGVGEVIEDLTGLENYQLCNNDEFKE